MRCSQSILLVWFLLGFYLLLSRVCQLFEGRSQSVHSRIPGTGWGQHTPVEEETSVWDGWPLCLAPVLSSRFSTGRPTPSTPPCNVHPRHEPLSLQIPDTHPPTHIFTHVYPMLLSPSSWLLKPPHTNAAPQQGTKQANPSLDSQTASKRMLWLQPYPYAWPIREFALECEPVSLEEESLWSLWSAFQLVPTREKPLGVASSWSVLPLPQWREVSLGGSFHHKVKTSICSPSWLAHLTKNSEVQLFSCYSDLFCLLKKRKDLSSHFFCMFIVKWTVFCMCMV